MILANIVHSACIYYLASADNSPNSTCNIFSRKSPSIFTTHRSLFFLNKIDEATIHLATDDEDNLSRFTLFSNRYT